MSHRRSILRTSINQREAKVNQDQNELHNGNPSPTRAQILRRALVHENKYLGKERKELNEED